MGASMNFGELGYYRVAAVTPPLALGDPAANARATLEAARRAAARRACVAVFPELGLTGYTCEDLFRTAALLERTREALDTLARASAELPLAMVVGAPLPTPDGRLFNAALVLHGGRIRGAVPKIHLPTYGEFYERRWFASGRDVDVALDGFRLAARQLFAIGGLRFAVEICEDLWAPEPPSGGHALAGAHLILNLSASNELVAKADYRRELVRQQSARLNAAYAYVSCGPRESTKDLVYGGHAMIAEDGHLLAEGPRLEMQGGMVTADVDVQKLDHERHRNMTFQESARPAAYPVERLGADVPALPSLERAYPKTPFVPDTPATVHERAREILAIQSAGLARRLEAARAERAVIGVSGGLDSTLALLVCVEAAKRRPTGILGVSMPGPGTSDRTRKSAAALAKVLDVEFREIPIHAAVEQHLRDLGHKGVDVVYENAQARERTQILFDLANQRRGIVVGTGDLSELALGWCTYNADHMGNYGVNVSVPKTLVKHLVRWYAEHVAGAGLRDVLLRVLDTVISPELLPLAADGGIDQCTEDLIGPYVLHDFFLFHHLRYGAGPRKVFALAARAFDGEFAPDVVKRWLRVFLERFYRQQFKRTTLPPGPKVGSVSLSPRGDLRMPDEVDPAALLAEVDALEAPAVARPNAAAKPRSKPVRPRR
jgi:NAD+ synthase (glutamine-hydrolysing)